MLESGNSARNLSDTELPPEMYDRSAPLKQDAAPEPVGHWFDGDRRRDLYLTGGLVAEVGPTEAGATRLRSLRPEAEEVANAQSGVRLWNIEANTLDVVQELSSTEGEGGFSPVFHEGAGELAGRCALTGGIVVRFPRGTTDEQISAFLAEENLAGERIGNLGTSWSIESEPGLASLELANRLHELEITEYASPNVWREVSTR